MQMEEGQTLCGSFYQYESLLPDILDGYLLVLRQMWLQL